MEGHLRMLTLALQNITITSPCPNHLRLIVNTLNITVAWDFTVSSEKKLSHSCAQTTGLLPLQVEDNL